MSLLCFVKTDVGFGGIFGTGSFKNFPAHFLTPGVDRNGQEGWLYSEPVDEPVLSLPRDGMMEEETGLIWYPRKLWTDEERSRGRLPEYTVHLDLFFAYAWCRLDVTAPGPEPVILQGHHEGALTLYLDGTEMYKAPDSGHFRVRLPRRYGTSDLVVKGLLEHTGERPWGFTLEQVEARETAVNSSVSRRLEADAAASCGWMCRCVALHRAFRSGHRAFASRHCGNGYRI